VEKRTKMTKMIETTTWAPRDVNVGRV